MAKEPKKSDSSTIFVSNRNNSLESSSSENVSEAPSNSSKTTPLTKTNPFTILGKEVRATTFYTQGYLNLNLFTLFWLFVGASIIGLVLETIYHAIVFGGYESRAGLVWGPFSPIYGAGAVLLTLFLNRYYHSHNLVIFLIAMVIGSVLEYVTSWGMEVFWGAIAWDYTGTFGSIQGRTNFFFGMMWGMLGLFWVRLILPVVKRVFDCIDSENKIVQTTTALIALFMVLDISCTCLALAREKERVDGVPAISPVQVFCDEAFPQDFMDTRFENMTVTGSNTSAPDGSTAHISNPFF